MESGVVGPSSAMANGTLAKTAHRRKTGVAFPTLNPPPKNRCKLIRMAEDFGSLQRASLGGDVTIFVALVVGCLLPLLKRAGWQSWAGGLVYKTYAFLTAKSATACLVILRLTMWIIGLRRKLMATVTLALVAFAALSHAATQEAAASGSKVRTVGTIKSISANTIVLTTDSGSEVTVVLQPSTKLLRMAPGQTDLKQATAIQTKDLQVGDRLLAGGTSGDGGKSVMATTAVIMTKADLAAKQEREREDWQKRGVAGVVKAVDAGTGTITLSTGTSGGGTLKVQVGSGTIIRRYAPDSVKFDDAKPGTLAQIKPSDQLRARGTKSADGNELAAEEIVSGTFRNVAGTVVTADPTASTLTLTDLATKRPVTVRINSDSQMRKLPPTMAQRIAMRLKGGAPNSSAGGAAGAPAPARASETQGAGGAGGFRQGGTPDFQQMLMRLPVVTLADLQKGDALMIVATEGSAEVPSTAIILLSGVEPILTAAPREASTILSPWNLGGGNLGTGDTP
jgi:hypothetical protein